MSFALRVLGARLWCALVLACAPMVASAAQVAAMEATTQGSRVEPVVLLSTYVVSPARLAKLVAAAQQAGVPLRVVSAETDTPATAQHAVTGAQLVLVSACSLATMSPAVREPPTS